jgi:hypothetical protein
LDFTPTFGNLRMEQLLSSEIQIVD